ncbi:MAG: ABC transporter permease [Desulfurococcaceae archaeon]|jgi:simple sugar transport system permease protein|nr:ABC transporter permease [Desulfurococcaceae archaeon]
MIGEILNVIIAMSPIFVFLYLASLGNSLVEKSGILNLAIDGAYTLGVALVFTLLVFVNDPTLALLITSLLIGLLGVLIAFLTTKLPISHGAVGLSIQFVGYGLASFLAYPMSLKVRAERISLNTYLTIPEVVLTFLTLSVVIGVLTYLLIYRTKLGAAIRAVGENPAGASALGINVLKIRIVATFLGYVLIGSASSLYLLLYTKNWQEGLGMGYGWISFAISLSSGRHPLVGIATSIIFATLIRYAYVLQDVLVGYGISISTFIVIALPFIAAVFIPLVVTAIPQLRRRFAPPKHLGKIFFSEERSV